jgi:hypothetical protein
MHEHALDPPLRQSYLQWFYSSMGMPTLLLIVGSTLLVMVLVVLLAWRGRGPAVPSAIFFVLPLPLVIAAVCFLGGSITYLSELAEAGDGPISHTTFSYALTASLQASSCFCPLLMLSLLVLMVVGIRTSGTKE